MGQVNHLCCSQSCASLAVCLYVVWLWCAGGAMASGALASWLLAMVAAVRGTAGGGRSVQLQSAHRCSTSVRVGQRSGSQQPNVQAAGRHGNAAASRRWDHGPILPQGESWMGATQQLRGAQGMRIAHARTINRSFKKSLHICKLLFHHNNILAS